MRKTERNAEKKTSRPPHRHAKAKTEWERIGGENIRFLHLGLKKMNSGGRLRQSVTRESLEGTNDHPRKSIRNVPKKNKVERGSLKEKKKRQQGSVLGKEQLQVTNAKSRRPMYKKSGEMTAPKKNAEGGSSPSLSPRKGGSHVTLMTKGRREHERKKRGIGGAIS